MKKTGGETFTMDIFTIITEYFTKFSLADIEWYSVVAGLSFAAVFFCLNLAKRPLAIRVLLTLLFFVFAVFFLTIAKFFATVMVWYLVYLILG